MTEKYFDLHITGLGYLNRIREVHPKRGQNFLAVEISALHGAAEAVKYTRFDCRVSGREAERLVRAAIKHLKAKRKVLVGFKLGDLYPELEAGQTGVSLKARLLQIGWVKVDGKTVYTAPKPEAGSETENPPPRRNGATDAVAQTAQVMSAFSAFL